jgi:hypothetical protein
MRMYSRGREGQGLHADMCSARGNTQKQTWHRPDFPFVLRGWMGWAPSFIKLRAKLHTTHCYCWVPVWTGVAGDDRARAMRPPCAGAGKGAGVKPVLFQSKGKRCRRYDRRVPGRGRGRESKRGHLLGIPFALPWVPYGRPSSLNSVLNYDQLLGTRVRRLSYTS